MSSHVSQQLLLAVEDIFEKFQSDFRRYQSIDLLTVTIDLLMAADDGM